jgi:threonine dehydrogenase-like Zn-dependent dehydrogenase
MKALTWHEKRDVRVDNVPDPTIQEPTDAIIRITTTAICGSDLHLYKVLDPFLNAGDILGHEPIGIVEEVGPEVTNLQPGDRMVIPFQIFCGYCVMCEEGLQTQCETTQVRDQGMGAALFGYTDLYGEVAGAQAEYLRVPQAQYTHIKVPEGPPLLGLSSTQLLFPIIPLAHDVLLEGKASPALVRTRPHGRWRSTLPAAAPRLLIA